MTCAALYGAVCKNKPVGIRVVSVPSRPRRPGPPPRPRPTTRACPGRGRAGGRGSRRAAVPLPLWAPLTCLFFFSSSLERVPTWTGTKRPLSARWTVSAVAGPSPLNRSALPPFLCSLRGAEAQETLEEGSFPGLCDRGCGIRGGHPSCQARGSANKDGPTSGKGGPWVQAAWTCGLSIRSQGSLPVPPRRHRGAADSRRPSSVALLLLVLELGDLEGGDLLCPPEG